MIINIHTDGSCNNQPKGRLAKIGGYSCIIDLQGGIRKYLIGGEMNTTSARMELAALQASLLYVNKHHKGEKVRLNIYTDAEYIANSINNNWLWDWAKAKFATCKNPDLWRTIVTQLGLEAIHGFSITHVKGHSGIELNELADKQAELARQQMAQFNKDMKINCYNGYNSGDVMYYKYNEL